MYYKIETMPENGKFYIVYDKKINMYDICNLPKGYALGKWYDINKSWKGGSTLLKATHWTEIPPFEME